MSISTISNAPPTFPSKSLNPDRKKHLEFVRFSAVWLETPIRPSSHCKTSILVDSCIYSLCPIPESDLFIHIPCFAS